MSIIDKHIYIYFSFFVLLFGSVNAQTKDTLLNEIAPVEIKAYFNSQSMLGLTTSAGVVTNKVITSQSPTTIINGINSIPGVRMEERSPGSNRLALRGSMIRSPFGVRNTKVYLDEIPFTDASGNTYLNLIDPVGIDHIQVIKGPDGSLYGPNSGGVVRIIPNGFSNSSDNEKSILLSSGSFGLFQEQLNIKHQVSDKYNFTFSQAFLRSDGYREQSGMNKKYFQTTHRWDYTPKGTLKLMAFYADLDYQTPGGLTEAQYLENARQSRPAGGPFPSAKDQKAAIFNKTFLSGITHEYEISEKLRHVITVFGTYTDFKNPFVTNYEIRNENNLGLRTYFDYKGSNREDLVWEMQVGAEGQQGWYDIKNYENNLGTRGDINYDDHLENFQNFYFYRAKILAFQRLTAEASIGLNINNIQFRQQQVGGEAITGERNFKNAWMPRIGISYLIMPQLSLRTSIAKGYSTPTISEVRSSDNQINQNLNPEQGVNYEAGLRFEAINRRVIFDFAMYQYKMNDGIIRQLNEDGAEYFNNAGKIDQKGLEASILSKIVSAEKGSFLESLILSSNLTYQHYKFIDYKIDNNDYSGNWVTSIPKWMWVNALSFGFQKQFQLNLSHNFTSSIPLNDANSFYSKKYHLVQAKLIWNTPVFSGYRLQLFIGADNLLNEKYSLGNDINAIGNRYFNASPTRNYYGGMKLIL